MRRNGAPPSALRADQKGENTKKRRRRKRKEEETEKPLDKNRRRKSTKKIHYFPTAKFRRLSERR
jgi:hypothetical protein